MNIGSNQFLSIFLGNRSRSLYVLNSTIMDYICIKIYLEIVNWDDHRWYGLRTQLSLVTPVPWTPGFSQSHT